MTTSLPLAGRRAGPARRRTRSGRRRRARAACPSRSSRPRTNLPSRRRRCRAPGPPTTTSRRSRAIALERARAERALGRLRQRLGHVLRRQAPRRPAGTPAGVATVTRPAPDRSAPTAARCAAPVFPRDPATTSTWPKSPLWASGRRAGTSVRTLVAREQLARAARRGASMTSSGIPMSATTRSPASTLGGRQDERQLRRGERDGERSPGCTGRSPPCVSADMPLGRSIDDDRDARCC